MIVTIKKNITVEKIRLEKGDEGWVQAIQLNTPDGDLYLLQIQGHSYVPVSLSYIEFKKPAA